MSLPLTEYRSGVHFSPSRASNWMTKKVAKLNEVCRARREKEGRGSCKLQLASSPCVMLSCVLFNFHPSGPEWKGRKENLAEQVKVKVAVEVQCTEHSVQCASTSGSGKCTRHEYSSTFCPPRSSLSVYFVCDTTEMKQQMKRNCQAMGQLRKKSCPSESCSLAGSHLKLVRERKNSINRVIWYLLTQLILRTGHRHRQVTAKSCCSPHFEEQASCLCVLSPSPFSSPLPGDNRRREKEHNKERQERRGEQEERTQKQSHLIAREKSGSEDRSAKFKLPLCACIGLIVSHRLTCKCFSPLRPCSRERMFYSVESVI